MHFTISLYWYNADNKEILARETVFMGHFFDYKLKERYLLPISFYRYFTTILITYFEILKKNMR